MGVRGEYKLLSENDIINKAKDGDQSAIESVLKRYEGLIKSKANTFFLIGGDRDDIIQEGMIGLYKAIQDFRLDKNSSFFNFAELCINRQIYNAIKASNRKKNIPLNTYISLNSPVYSDESGESTSWSLLDTLFLDEQLDPEKLVIDKVKASMIECELVGRLSALEKEVLDLFMKDLTYIQIAKKLEKEPKVIDNALTRIKSKLNQVLAII